MMIVCAGKDHLYHPGWATDLNWPLPVACCQCAVESWKATPETNENAFVLTFEFPMFLLIISTIEKTFFFSDFSFVLTVVTLQKQSNPEIHHIICIFVKWIVFKWSLKKQKSLKNMKWISLSENRPGKR